MSFKTVWVPRLFIAAILPSVAMVIALIFFPHSQIAQCPLFQQNGISMRGQWFKLNNTVVSKSSLDLEIILLGIVFDVSSGSQFYGPSGPYRKLVNGEDVTRALVLADLDHVELTDLSSVPRGVLREKLREWLPFFLNKYGARGVRAGSYWDDQGRPTELLDEMFTLIEGEPPLLPTTVSVFPDCVFSKYTVTCTNARLDPKILKSRGIGKCACIDENEIYEIEKSLEFVVVHYDDCEGNVCQAVLPK